MLQEQRLDMYYDMGGYFLESGNISKKLKDMIDRILKKIRDFFKRDTGDGNQVIEVPENAIKESKSFLDNVKKAFQKIKHHPKAVLSVMGILATIGVAKIWQSKDCKKIGVKRSELTNLLKQAEEAEKEARSLQEKYENELYGSNDFIKGDLENSKKERLDPKLKQKNDKIRENIEKAKEDQRRARDKRKELERTKMNTGIFEYASKIEQFLRGTVGCITRIINSIFSFLSLFK